MSRILEIIRIPLEAIVAGLFFIRHYQALKQLESMDHPEHQ